MNSNMILSWSIVILATTSLIFYFRIRNRKKEAQILSVLHSFAREYDCILYDLDHWSNTLIGIANNNSNRLFFIRTIHNEEYRVAVNLSGIISCRMQKSESHINYNKEVNNIIEKIEIVLSFSDKQTKDVVLEFYNAEYDQLTIWRELELAQKWVASLNSVILANQIFKKESKYPKLLRSAEINKSVNKEGLSYTYKRKPKDLKHAY